MANVLHRTTKEYRTSVNTPDYPVSDWIINPVILPLVARKYWKIVGDTVQEMSLAEKQAVDTAETQAQWPIMRENIRTNLTAILSKILFGLATGSPLTTAQKTRLTTARDKVWAALVALKNTATDPATIAMPEAIDDLL
jgi:hypothetical protein